MTDLAARPALVRNYLEDLQKRITGMLEAQDGEARFKEDPLPYPKGGLSRPMVLEAGPVIERSAVNFTHSLGDSLPPAATAERPQMAGRAFQAVSLSLIVHPRNPYAPTTHANLRYFQATAEGQDPIWWFGGGFDLTPYYGFTEDCVAWHRAAQAACDPSGESVYDELRQWCDRYFHLHHRKEQRGIGGVFFDDWDRGGFDESFALVRRVGDAFVGAYRDILAARKDHPWGDAQRRWQLLRRGRYVEFNLVIDRGTLYGLQSGRRIEAVLGSMPPMVAWEYDHHPAPGSDEARLLDYYLQPRDWARLS